MGCFEGVAQCPDFVAVALFERGELGGGGALPLVSERRGGFQENVVEWGRDQAEGLGGQ